MNLKNVEFEFLDETLGMISVSFPIGELQAHVAVKNSGRVYVDVEQCERWPTAGDAFDLIEKAKENWRMEGRGIS